MYQFGNPLDNFSAGLRAGQAVSGMINANRSTNALQEAQARINAGEDANAVMQQLMAQNPQAAQQLMNMQQGNLQLQAQQQEMEQLKKKYGMQSLQMSALPLLGAVMQDDPAIQDKLIDEASAPFRGQSDGVFETLQQVKGLQGKQRVDALTGIVKTLRQAGIYPDDPSQLAQGGVAGEQIRMLQEMEARNDPYAAQFRQMILPGERAQAQAEVKLRTEQGLNPVLAQREAGKIQATEQTATGQAQLQQEQQAVAKGQREVAESARAKENAVSSINQQLQQLNTLKSHKGFESAVGASSYIPSLRGSDAYGFERQLEKLDAQSFMAMIPNLAGMGALSNAEGQKVSAALSALNVGMSEEEFKREMKVIEDTLMQARERIRSGNLIKPEQQAVQQPAQTSTIGRFKIEVE